MTSDLLQHWSRNCLFKTQQKEPLRLFFEMQQSHTDLDSFSTSHAAPSSTSVSNLCHCKSSTSRLPTSTLCHTTQKGEAEQRIFCPPPMDFQGHLSASTLPSRCGELRNSKVRIHLPCDPRRRFQLFFLTAASAESPSLFVRIQRLSSKGFRRTPFTDPLPSFGTLLFVLKPPYCDTSPASICSFL